jgi:hypothetical protein
MNTSLSNILAARIRVTLERDYLAQVTADGRLERACSRGVSTTSRLDPSGLGLAGSGGWGTRPLRGCTARRAVLDHDSLGWGTRTI